MVGRASYEFRRMNSTQTSVCVAFLCTGRCTRGRKKEWTKKARFIEGLGCQERLNLIGFSRGFHRGNRLLTGLVPLHRLEEKGLQLALTFITMRQGSKELFSAFLPRFEKALADAGGMAWPDEVKRSYLDGALTILSSSAAWPSRCL